MALKPSLDLALAACCLRITLPGNWQLHDVNSWDEFWKGRGSAIRTIRHRGKKYWVEVSRSREDDFAALVAFGLNGRGARWYSHFNLHLSDPREGYKRGNATTLGGVGVITRIDKALAGLKARSEKLAG